MNTDQDDGVIARVYDDGEHIANLTTENLVSEFQKHAAFDVEVLDDGSA